MQTHPFTNMPGGPEENGALIGGFRRDVTAPYWPSISLPPPLSYPGPMGMSPGAMAEDEQGGCVMLGEKLLKKPRRIRTRVDAGEPRNPYSGLFPNLCGAVTGHSVNKFLSAGQTFCALPFVNYLAGNGSRSMLSELFAGPKPVGTGDNRMSAMGVLNKVTNTSTVHTSDTLNSVIRGPEAENALLREILQGRKRDLLTMEELDAARALHNNNISYKSEHITSSNNQTDDNSRDDTRPNSGSVNSEEDHCDSDVEEPLTPRPSSPSSDSDPKKNRLENIVSVIRSSPTPPTPVNGCKKRKLYLPQQHESRPQTQSPNEEESSIEPENKTRRIATDNEQRQEKNDDGGLQIDLSVRRSPDIPRSSVNKIATSASSDVIEPSSYLLDYAKHLFRSQHIQRDENKSSPDISEKLQMLRNINVNTQVTDLVEGLADVLKTEITASLAVIIDSIVNKYIQQRKLLTKQAEAAAEQLNRDIAHHLIERSRSPRPNSNNNNIPTAKERNFGVRLNGFPAAHPPIMAPYSSENNLNSLNLPQRPLYKNTHLFQNALPTSTSSVPMGPTSPYSSTQTEPEQDEALSLVVTPKKKRHKVTDSRLTPRTVGRLLEDLPRYPHPVSMPGTISPRGSPPPHNLVSQPPPRPAFPQPPPPLLPVSLPTSVAIPNPSLHETSLLYPSYYRGTTSPETRRGESPLPHHPPHHHPLLHPAAILAASSPDSFSHFLRGSEHDRNSDCSPADNHYDMQPPLSFYPEPHSSTLTPMHLRKAKLMFFFVRYPSSSVLKTFFPDIKFNKNNTAQLVKWFSNFREFYYIQMEKYARQAISEGVKSVDEITVTMDSELIRVLNLHYNRNNHLEIPDHFQYVAEQTLKEFYKALKEGKDAEQSWKKAIYKVIARMDETVPEYFKSPSFLDQLE